MKFDATSYEMGRQAGGGGGGSAVIESITITQNGTTTAPSGVDGYSPITVAVPAPTPTYEQLNITVNGTYTPSSGYDAIDQVVVAVPAPAINLQNKSISANGTYTADQGYDGLGQVVVNVAGGQSMYDLTGNIDGICASPQATQWFGANYAYINSISNITSMKASFQGVSAVPNKPITLATTGADCRNAFKDANLTALPAMSGKITAAADMFAGATIGTIDLQNVVYDPDYSKDDPNGFRLFDGLNNVDTIYMPAEVSGYQFSGIFYNKTVKHIIDQFNSQEQTVYTQTVPQGWDNNPNNNMAFYFATYLREIPLNFLSFLGTMPYNPDDDYWSVYYMMFHYCNDLDAIDGLPVVGMSNNGTDPLTDMVRECNHLSDLIFDYNPNQVANWNGRTLNLGDGWNVGYGLWCHLPAEKKITDAASYAALKNDPDAWTSDYNYSRYNHRSAVDTINSLPQLQSGNTCAIVFFGNAGSLTDAGAISTLTNAEIAVATAKGWTVSLN